MAKKPKKGPNPVKAGDVAEDGNIVTLVPGYAMAAGQVVIHRSRLHRARKFGWRVVPGPFVPPPGPGMVVVERRLDESPD